jgi:hypothetical protein
MLASTDPVLFLVLVAVLLLLLLAVRGNKRRQAVHARLLAHATGHPSTGLRRGLSPAQRATVARDLADQLAAAGMIAERMDDGVFLIVRALDGEYTVDVHPDSIVTQYLDNRGVHELARSAGPVAAVRSIAEHARLTTG